MDPRLHGGLPFPPFEEEDRNLATTATATQISPQKRDDGAERK